MFVSLSLRLLTQTEQKLYFCGNYVMGTTQIEVTSVHGVAEADHAEHGHD